MSRLLFSAVFPVAFVSVFSLSVNAKETTWIGGSCGYISDSANWDNGVPAGGDKVIFNKSVSLSNNTESATFEMGEGGLEFCIAPNCTLTDRVSYSGVGDLKLTGGGTWDFYGGIKIGGNSYSVGDFIGNVEVVNGIFCPGVNTWYRYCLGGNRNDVKIKVHLDTGGRLNLTKYQTILCNDVIFMGGDDVELSMPECRSASRRISGAIYIPTAICGYPLDGRLNPTKRTVCLSNRPIHTRYTIADGFSPPGKRFLWIAHPKGTGFSSLPKSTAQ